LYTIPNELFLLISRKYFRLQSNTISTKYVNLFKNLIHNDIFIISESKGYFKQFQDLDLVWDSPAIFTNCVISHSNAIDYKILNNELESVGCKDIQIQFDQLIHFTELETVLSKFERSSIKNIELIFSRKFYSLNYLHRLTKTFPRVQHIIMYNSKTNEYRKIRNGDVLITSLKTDIDYGLSKSKLSPNLFVLNLKLYLETLYWNNYYNKKLFINANGHIIRTIGDRKIFGKIGETNLIKLSKSRAYTKFWKIKKSNILECRNCEFRFACVDDRLPLKKKQVWTFSKACNYSPKSIEWKKQN